MHITCSLEIIHQHTQKENTNAFLINYDVTNKRNDHSPVCEKILSDVKKFWKLG